MSVVKWRAFLALLTNLEKFYNQQLKYINWRSKQQGECAKNTCAWDFRSKHDRTMCRAVPHTNNIQDYLTEKYRFSRCASLLADDLFSDSHSIWEFCFASLNIKNFWKLFKCGSKKCFLVGYLLRGVLFLPMHFENSISIYQTICRRQNRKEEKIFQCRV